MTLPVKLPAGVFPFWTELWEDDGNLHFAGYNSTIFSATIGPTILASTIEGNPQEWQGFSPVLSPQGQSINSTYPGEGAANLYFYTTISSWNFQSASTPTTPITSRLAAAYFNQQSATMTSSSSSATSPTASTTATITTISAGTSGGGGGIPEFPYQILTATAFTFVLIMSYVIVRRVRHAPYE